MKKYFLFLFFLSTTAFGQLISTEKQVTKDSTFITFVNDNYVSIEFNIKLKEEKYKNLFKFKQRIVIKAKNKVDSVLSYANSLKQDTTKTLSDYLIFNGTFGNQEDVSHNDDYEYLLPFPCGKKYKVIQGYNGKFSHSTPSSKYALDFNLQVGDTVTASREGRVFYIKEDSKEYGASRKYMGKANKVMIVHNDGSMASYVHLKYNEVFVNVGDSVDKGDRLGIVGMSGFTSTPHLHFVVHKEKSLSIPTKFKDVKNGFLKSKKKYSRKTKCLYKG